MHEHTWITHITVVKSMNDDTSWLKIFEMICWCPLWNQKFLLLSPFTNEKLFAFYIPRYKSAYYSCKMQKPKCMLVNFQVFSLLVMLMYFMYGEVLSKGCCYAVL